MVTTSKQTVTTDMKKKILQGGDSYPSSLAGIKGGQLRSRVKRVLRDSDPKMTALARASSNCKQRQTRPLVREVAPTQQTRKCQTIIEIWS
jgi:hypothetical protein